MTKIKLYVSLKIPDTTSITAFHTLERLGYKELKKLEREDYYEFEVLKDHEKFIEDIQKVDILVNANKHFSKAIKAGDEPKEDTTNIIVTDSDNDFKGLFSTLRESMGFVNLNSVKKGVLWKMTIDAENKEEIAEKITKDLLCNEHYQKFEIL